MARLQPKRVVIETVQATVIASLAFRFRGSVVVELFAGFRLLGGSFLLRGHGARCGNCTVLRKNSRGDCMSLNFVPNTLARSCIRILSDFNLPADEN